MHKLHLEPDWGGPWLVAQVRETWATKLHDIDFLTNMTYFGHFWMFSPFAFRPFVCVCVCVDFTMSELRQRRGEKEVTEDGSTGSASQKASHVRVEVKQLEHVGVGNHLLVGLSTIL